jgi:hypothetical protein
VFSGKKYMRMQHVPPKKSIKNAFEYYLENIFSMEILKTTKTT